MEDEDNGNNNASPAENNEDSSSRHSSIHPALALNTSNPLTQHHSILKDNRRRGRSTDTANNSAASPGTSPQHRVSFDNTFTSGLPSSATIRSTSNRLAAITDLDIQKALQSVLKQRRTSLPVNSNALLSNRSAVCFIFIYYSSHVHVQIQSNISEARGLVVDMLANRDLPPAVKSCLRVVATLLNPQPPAVSIPSSEIVLPLVVENPLSGEQLVVSTVSFFEEYPNKTVPSTSHHDDLTIYTSLFKKRFARVFGYETKYARRCLQTCLDTNSDRSQASKPRVSNITFSTVTSATGLPTIAAEPSRPRSSSYWKPPERERDEAAASGALQSPPASPSSSSQTSTSHQAHTYNGLYSFVKHLTSVAHLRWQSIVPVCNFRSDSEISDDLVQTVDGIQYNTKELQSDRLLSRISEWAFPIFDLAHSHPQTTLSRLAYAIFKEANLFRIFKLSTSKFFNFFHALERGYWDIPSDVLHGCFYLTVHPVKASFSTPDSPCTTASIPIAHSMSTLEVMALYTAAAMHDYDHPGRTNAFLVAAEDKKAILYNDRSVLENHHAAESWRLLCRSENCFIDTLDAAETKRFRYLVLEYILATDLKQHFDIIMQFNEKSADMDLNNEADRVLISEMIIKFADINSPSKPYRLHKQWTKRICDEFYEQGDEEKRRGMAVSPYMDRNDPSVAKLQDSFIAHIVSPLAVALNEVGLLPVLPGLEEAELIINLKHNHQKWLSAIEAQNNDSDTNTDKTSNQLKMMNNSINSSNSFANACNQSDVIEEEVRLSESILQHL
ncbi:unnamed protein product [Anisakis simplex]|uniref:Phosphodiesterase n=1 Tax=Anisakis simplex TaxID=6269 RepID=A0A0M3JT41_ANISI|nr:unnamed protein product [Anisakis simplex]